jgi:Polysaccharide lyase
MTPRPSAGLRVGAALASLAALGALAASGSGPGAPLQRAAALGGTVLASGDFETGTLDQWGGQYVVAERSARVVRRPVRQGRFAARFEVRNGDNPIGFGDRSQVALQTDEREGQVRSYQWSTLFAKDFPSYSAWQVAAEWHANADGPPPLGFYVERDSLVLRANRHSGPGRPLGAVDLWRGPLRRGRWVDIGLRVRWSGRDKRGWVELWIDGARQRLDDGSYRRAVRTMYPGRGNYFILGYYRASGLRRTGVVYHDGFRMMTGRR